MLIGSHRAAGDRLAKGEKMKTTIMNAVLAGFISAAAVGLVGCADTVDTAPAYTPPVTTSETTTTREYTSVQPATRVVDVPTTLTTVPATANSTTVTTQFSNGTVEKRTTTDYNPAYTTMGPPYATTVVTTPAVVAAAPVMTVPANTTTRTTTTSDDDGSTLQKRTTTTVTSPGY
jgi:hypothetical protein